MKHKPWTDEEEQFLLDHHNTKSNVEIAKALNRTKYAVQQKKSAMRLVNPYSRALTAIYEVTRGYEILATGTADECASTLGLKRQTIYFYASETQLSRVKDLDNAVIAMRIN